jgi:uncharacterized protein (TIGR04141 family)
VFKITKNKNLIIYLMDSNQRNFKDYLKEQYRTKVTRHYIDKQSIVGDVEKGIIFLYEEVLPFPEWVGYLNTISEKKKIKLSSKKASKAVVFLTINSPEKKTFALTFGNGISLLDNEYIVPDFGLKVSKSLLEIKQIISIDTTSLDKKFFNTKKQSAAFLMPEKLLEYGTQSIIRNVHGTFKEFNEKFSLGGNESLNFKGDIDLTSDLGKWLTQFATIYTNQQNNLGISDDLVAVGIKEKQTLDDKLAEKILNIINTSPITGRQVSPLKIAPNATFDLDDFNGFFISGLGYKNSMFSSDFFIDEVNFFERFKRQLKPDNNDVSGILRKLKTDKIHRKILSSGDLEPICSIYKAISYETTYKSNRYVLVSGTWYEINKDFYSNLQKDIDAIEAPNDNKPIRYIDFDSKKHFKMVKKKEKLESQASEGKYNEELAKENCILMLDRKDYRVDPKTMKRYGFKSQSSIELCDVIYFDNQTIQFVHVKRHSNAAGTSHLLTQALVASEAFLNDTSEVIKHINLKIQEFNAQKHPYSIRSINYENQRKEVVLAIIDKKKNIQKSNSKLLSLLEMISLRENIRSLEHLGFKCYLKFIPGD